MTVGSLFAGIGGFDLGFERAGFEIRWQVEIDPFARRVLEKHWPNVTRYFDVRKLRSPEPVDVICGGFPCQPHSLAGRRGGSADERDLWPEFARIIRAARPRWVVAENVPGLLSSDAGRFFGTVLGDLAACGYDAEWDCLPAAAFGAHHQRDRVWIVAYPRSAGRDAGRTVRSREGRALPESARSGEDVADAASRARQRATSRQARHVAFSSQAMADADDQRELQPQGCESDEWRWARDGGARIFSDADGQSARWSKESWRERSDWIVEPNVGRVAHGIPARVDRLRGLGNAIVPQIAQWIAERIKAAEGIAA